MQVFKLFMVICLSLVIVDANAQKEKQKIKTKKTTKDTLTVQPPNFPPPDIEIKPATPEDELKEKLEVFDRFKIDFDTTDVPHDSLTLRIKKLLIVTKVKETDLEMAEKSLNESLGAGGGDSTTKAMIQKFHDRFMFEMKEGRAAKWLENLYIRNYRTLFTLEEIQALIDFYQTPVGQKSLERSKILIQNVMGEAKKIGAYLGADLMKEIMSEEFKK